MTDAIPHQPRKYLGVMVSSTFKDLEQHRAALLDALRKEELFAIGMEDYVPVPSDDVIGSSLSMVRKGAAYIGLISHRCGQVLECLERNPNSYSVTRLEFEEAQRLGLPTLIFVMSQEHAVKPAHVEREERSIAKLNEFKNAAKAGRIYIEFDSLEDFTPKAIHAVGSLRRYIEEHAQPAARTFTVLQASETTSTIPHAPAFYAHPDYIGSHQFVGRQTELDALSAWANRSDPTNLLLFEAIGGNGKSMLTWEWATKHASNVRSDWAGRFWYSFYERGAIMQDFCQRALAYMTGRPLKEFEKRKTADLRVELIAQLHSRAWLLILDGLERVLVAYHRIDAAEVFDEEANVPTDKILNRNPCAAIRDEDSDLLRALASCSPSKILVSSRLTPRILLNPAGQPIPGASRNILPGLHSSDAEALLKQCGVTGDSAAIQDYLHQNCGNHPLVIGVLAGLIANYLPDRGNFDAWSVDPVGGAALDLAKLDLIQRRNHILLAAITALSDDSRRLMSIFALLPESVDYETLGALNPFMPPEPEEIGKPSPPSEFQDDDDDPRRIESRKRRYDADLKEWIDYQEKLANWRESLEYKRAIPTLTETVKDLETRGLLQFDWQSRRFDLHPVVRSVVSSKSREDQRTKDGERVIDYFSTRYRDPIANAKTLSDVSAAIHIVKTWIKIENYEKAARAYRGNLARALLFNLEAHIELLALLRPLFMGGWENPPKNMEGYIASSLANDVAIALSRCDEPQIALVCNIAGLKRSHEQHYLEGVQLKLQSISRNLADLNQVANTVRMDAVTIEMAEIRKDARSLFLGLRSLFADQTLIGDFQQASATWSRLGPMGRKWSRASYRPGNVEFFYARWRFWQGSLEPKHLDLVADLAEKNNNRVTLRLLQNLRGAWRLEHHDWDQAAATFQEAVGLARERRLVDVHSETGLALAKFYLGQLTGDDARSEAKRLALLRQPAHRYLAMLWLAIGSPDKAKQHLLDAYRWAWADGEPYVHRYELTKNTELLQQMNVPVPVLPPYDPAKDEPFPWEADVRAEIEKLKAEKASAQRK